MEHSKRPSIDAFEAGAILGLLIGEGHFGGDRKQAHVTIKMHVRHEPLLRWVNARFPYPVSTGHTITTGAIISNSCGGEHSFNTGSCRGSKQHDGPK